MEQAISKLPTSSQFHATTSEPQLIPARLDFLSTSYGRSSGSGSSFESGRAWEERILDLSAELQQICGSPLTPPYFAPPAAATGSPEHHPRWSTTSSSSSSPPPPRLTAHSPRVVPSVSGTTSVSERQTKQWSTPPPPLRLTCSLGRCSDGSAAADLVRRTISLQGGGQSSPEATACHRAIMVRHEETQETLAKRLSAICGKTTTQSVTGAVVGVHDQQTGSTPPSDDSLSAAKLLTDVKDSSRVRIKADVGSCRVEDVVVAVSDDHLLTVAVNDGATLHRAELPAGVADCLLCHMNSSAGSVYILESPRGTGLTLEFTGTRPVFLPVIHCDEVHLVMTLVLRVPDEFRYDELSVKTVDDSVWIAGCRKRAGRSPLSTSGSDAPFSFLSQQQHGGSRLTDGGARRRFRVVVPLPKGCDNRSVVAALSPNNQLVLKAKLSAACRRYTF